MNNTNWFNEARYGMFIHWGAYAVAARGEWAANRERIPFGPAWRADICRALMQYLKWLEESDWSRRVSALFLCQGITWEAGYLGADGFPDYSTHAQVYFRGCWKSKYRTHAALSTAWGR